MLTKNVIRKDRKDKDGLCPLYLKVLAGGVRKLLILPMSGDLEYWTVFTRCFALKNDKRGLRQKNAIKDISRSMLIWRSSASKASRKRGILGALPDILREIISRFFLGIKIL